MGAQKIKKYIIFCFLAMLTILFQRQTVFAKPEGELTINVHYIRYNEDYEDWSLWLWGEGDGTEYEFTNRDGEQGVSARVELEKITGDSQIGVLLKYKDWEKKDVNDDRYLDLSKAKDGILDVYFVQEEEQIFYSEDEVQTRQGIIRAQYDDIDKVSFMVYSPEISAEQFKEQKICVEEENGDTYLLKISDLTQDGNIIKGTGELEHSVNLSASNYLLVDGMDKKIIEPGAIFSTKSFEDSYYYDGDDLGAVYSKEATTFRVWAPTASQVVVKLYEYGEGNSPIRSCPMEKSQKGTWYLELPGDYDGVYYTYSVTVHGNTEDAVDPYAKACGVNGLRGMIINLDNTNPGGFAEENKPALSSFSDIILYEMSVRDYTIDDSSGVKEKGKYLGLTEEGTVNSNGESTALDYLEELGVTHVHLLPSQDFGGVDEKNPSDSYNWGYGTQNFNVPEGSYSTNPDEGEVRVNEFKQMVQSLHKKGIRVVMDVVYNHTYDTEKSNFNKIVPGYYYRKTEDGGYSNGSACGNEVATERAMVRKFIADSVVYWAKEYHIDGFRFDLMGLIDIETMQLIRQRLDEVDESIYIYGEGWTGGDTVSTEKMAESVNAKDMPGIAVFSNVFRRGIQNYVSGIFDEDFTKNSVLFGVVAATENAETKESVGSWTENPMQCINYASCHDGFTLWDLIRQNCSSESEEMWKKRNRMSAAIVMTTQGVPFIQSGEELLRSKVAKDDPGRIYSNSYNANDYVNSIKWDSISEAQDMIAYYKGLMEFRKEHDGLSYETTEEIQKSLNFLDHRLKNVIAYTVKENRNLFFENTICMIYNPHAEEAFVSIPKGRWKVYINGEKAGIEVLDIVKGGTTVNIPDTSVLVMVSTSMRTSALCVCVGVIAVILAVFLIVVVARKRRMKNECGSNH